MTCDCGAAHVKDARHSRWCSTLAPAKDPAVPVASDHRTRQDLTAYMPTDMRFMPLSYYVINEDDPRAALYIPGDVPTRPHTHDGVNAQLILRPPMPICPRHSLRAEDVYHIGNGRYCVAGEDIPADAPCGFGASDGWLYRLRGKP